MYKPTYGHPVYTVRLPKPIIAAVKLMAKDEGRTTSEIIRGLVEQELKTRGYRITAEQLEGQTRIV